MTEPDAAPPFADPFQSMLGFQLRRASAAVMSALAEDLAPLGLKPSEATLVLLVATNPGCTQSALSRALRAKPANLVPLVNQLTALGVLERASGRGRAVALSLSVAGQVLAGEVRAAFHRNEARIARGVPEAARADTIALLRRICADACDPPDA